MVMPQGSSNYHPKLRRIKGKHNKAVLASLAYFLMLKPIILFYFYLYSKDPLDIG